MNEHNSDFTDYLIFYLLLNLSQKRKYDYFYVCVKITTKENKLFLRTSNFLQKLIFRKIKKKKKIHISRMKNMCKDKRWKIKKKENLVEFGSVMSFFWGITFMTIISYTRFNQIYFIFFYKNSMTHFSLGKTSNLIMFVYKFFLLPNFWEI